MLVGGAEGTVLLLCSHCLADPLAFCYAPTAFLLCRRFFSLRQRRTLRSSSGADEVARVAAAYSLARQSLAGGDAPAAVLGGGLQSEQECVRRASAYGLAQAGQAAVPVLLAALAAGLPPQVRSPMRDTTDPAC